MKKIIAILVSCILSFGTYASSPFQVKAESTEEYIYHFLTNNLGYSSAVACGFLANIFRESSFNPEADNGHAYGLIQWEGTRRTDLNNFCRNNGYSISSIDAQLLFIQYELEGSESGSASSFMNLSNDSDGAYWAAYYICFNYERPAKKDWKSNDRGEIARDTYWPIYGDGSASNNDDELGIPYPRPTGNPLIQKGSKGNGVRWVQYALQKLGYDIGSYGVDGDFGISTDAAVRAFQSDYGLEVDGQVGPATIAKIVELLKPLPQTNPIPSMPELTITASSQYSPVTLTWNNCENTDFYGVRVYYKSDDSYVKYIEPYDGLSYQISLQPGDYYATIAAVNNYGHYQICSPVSFTVTSGTIVPIACSCFNGHLYSVYDSETWYSNADAIAREFGGHLAAITSQEENDFITGLLAAGKHDAYWIGGTDTTTEGTFVWSTDEEMIYTNWREEQPDNYLEKEDYIEMNKNGFWNDNQNEVVTRGFVLEIDEMEPVASATYLNNSYKMFDTTMTWTDAKAYCELLGGHLACISSTEEDNVVYDMIKASKLDTCWIGGVRNGNSFEWIDKSKFEYTHWAQSQPDNANNAEDYMEIRIASGEWNDNRNTACSGFICEFENGNRLEIPKILMLQIGEKYAISSNNRKLTFKSHNAKIATISTDGIITAVSEGTAVISVVDEESNVFQIRLTVTRSAMKGDVDESGEVDVSDAVLLARFLAEDQEVRITQKGIANADANASGAPDSNDIVMILKSIAKMIEL